MPFHIVGPIASALGDKLGYRITAITGSILAAASFLAASFSVNVESLIILYGVLGGKIYKILIFYIIQFKHHT